MTGVQETGTVHDAEEAQAQPRTKTRTKPETRGVPIQVPVEMW